MVLLVCLPTCRYPASIYVYIDPRLPLKKKEVKKKPAMESVLQIYTFLFFSSLVSTLVVANSSNHAQRAGIVVEGVVYCQDCSRTGSWSMTGARPLVDAKVAITCRDHRHKEFYYKWVKTNEWGWFYEPLRDLDLKRYHMDTPSHACAAHLISSNDRNCGVATDANFGSTGSLLRYERTLFNGTKYEADVYSAGPMAFRPARCRWAMTGR